MLSAQNFAQSAIRSRRPCSCLRPVKDRFGVSNSRTKGVFHPARLSFSPQANMLGGKGAGVPTPNRVDSVEVKNNHSGPVKVKVVYDDHKEGKELVDEAEVPAGSSHHFGEKSLNMGSWTAVAPVKRVEAEGGSNSLTPSVTGIVKKLGVTIGEGVKLQQSH